MTYVDTFFHEYHWTRDHVVYELPLSLAHELMGAISTRYGHKNGSGYQDRARRAAKAKMKQYLNEHYTIV
jgi:hypothetical protein